MNGKYGKGKFTLVDIEDFEELSKYKWSVSKCGYVIRGRLINGSSKCFRMHREIMNPSDDLVVDHINGDKLDNRRVNLRVCTVGENGRNRSKWSSSKSGFKGVSLSRRKGKWYTNINAHNKSRYIGTFDDVEEAARAYDYYALKYFGEFAKLNFPNETPTKLIINVAIGEGESKYRGVFWSKASNKWGIAIQFNKKRRYLGLFDEEKDAARMYNFWATNLYGCNAKLNKIEEEF
ncbi:AP2 domain-containing protein [Bacillus thuringiensis]|uniref:AP2 domain-containing protein n=1 Tax=Bacillus thuringiensis TaxID=1428 RepID=UPI001C555DE2|nr:AP2 domain-containing protein [Bacillus thuringiensis]